MPIEKSKEMLRELKHDYDEIFHNSSIKLLHLKDEVDSKLDEILIESGKSITEEDVNKLIKEVSQ